MTDTIKHPHPKTPIRHGGGIDIAARTYGIPASDWIDLSTGINPVGYPVGSISTAQWQRLPLASELTALKEAAARYYGAPDARNITCAPGTQALIQTLPYWINDHIRPAAVHILGPTYAEHARCWQRAGHGCHLHDTPPATRADHLHNLLDNTSADSVAILVNPNNPDGGLLPVAEVRALAGHAAQKGCWLIVDEAFMDCEPEQSICPVINTLPQTIILRSFGKFFGLAGARLGCAVMAPELAQDLADRIGPWALPGPTIEIARRAFSDLDWQKTSRARLLADARRLDDMIARNTGLSLAGATPLFRYYQGQDCAKIAYHLARAGILVRLFDHDPHRVRFGLPGTESDWQRLQQALDHLT